MESRYFLFPGQTLENTKVSDRAHALHITAAEWGKIRKHLDRKKDIQELIEREESKRRYIAEGNRAMTEKWDNSLEKMRQCKHEARTKTNEEIQQEKVQNYYVMREEQEKLRKEYVENVKKKMFRTSGACNDLNSAFVTSEVLYEREKQKEFKEYLRKHEADVDAKFAMVIKEAALKEVEEKKEAARKVVEKNKKYGAYLQQIIDENATRERNAREKRVIKESEDNIRAVEEMERIKQVQEEEKVVHTKQIAAEMERYMKRQEEVQKQLKQEEKELEEVAVIYKEAKHRINCLEKEKEKELQNDIIMRREVVAKLVSTMDESKKEIVERQIKAAIAEKDAIEEAKIKTRAEYDERMRNERLEDRENYLKRREVEQKKEEEIRKWEMVNRYKVDEVNKKYQEEMRKEQWKKILRYRQELINQMDENEEERRRQQEFECSSFTTIDEQDNAFFEYADEILKFAKKRGRSTYPIEKVIMDYRKINSLLDKDIDCGNGNEAKKSPSMKAIKKHVKGSSCKCTTRKK